MSITWYDVYEMVEDLLSLYDEKIEDGPVDQQDIWKDKKADILKKKEAVLQRCKEQDEIEWKTVCRMQIVKHKRR